MKKLLNIIVIVVGFAIVAIGGVIGTEFAKSLLKKSNGNKIDTTEILKKLSNEMNKTCPMTIDKWTILKSTYARGNKLVYGFNLDKLGYVINFRDYGPGVPEHMQDRLFDPFFRVHIDRAQKHGGYGLGLSIAKRSIDLQGGNITATNHPDGGLEVSIFLPVELGS